MSKPIRDLTGAVFGRLTVVRFAGRILKGSRYRTYWNCICTCGQSCDTQRDNLISGDTRSCGCLFAPETNAQIRAWIEGMSIPVASGCREWTGALSNVGYGKAELRGKTTGAHRIAAHAWHGLDLSNRKLHACHRCDNRKCVNHEHIFIGTASDNIRDCVAKGRQNEARKTHCPAGHEYSEANTKIENGKRKCKECVQRRSRERSRKTLAA